LFRAISQPLFDPGDPINVASSVRSEVAVLLQAGKGDKVIPSDTSADLAAALRLSPLGMGSPQHVFVSVDAAWYQPPEMAAEYNGHNVMWDFVPIREQALKFLESDGQTLLQP
jgi:hypothetical protein